jgi:formylglycine-generating enzyme
MARERSVRRWMLAALAAALASVGCQDFSGYYLQENAAGGGGGVTAGAGGVTAGAGGACIPETDAAFCTRLGKNCGFLVDVGYCGPRTAECGVCVPPQTCGGNNVCGRGSGGAAGADSGPDTGGTSGRGGASETGGLTGDASAGSGGSSSGDSSAGAGGLDGAAGNGGKDTGIGGDAGADTATGGTGGADGGIGADGSTGGACGTAGVDASADSGGSGGSADASMDTVFVDGTPAPEPGSDGGSFVPANGQSCALQPDGGVLLCNGESCCTSIVVPGGTFPMGRGTEDCGVAGCQPGVGNEGCPNGPVTCFSDEQPEHSMTLASFALDKYEVTVGRFRNFVTAYGAGWRPAVGSGANPNVTVGDTSWQSGWDDSASGGTNLPLTGPNAAATQSNFAARLHCGYETWTDAAGSNENKAISCVSWFEAFAFCIWDGGRLPTEAEWEYAAAGGDENLIFPWGSTVPDCTYANFFYGYAEYFCTGSVVAVGSTPKGNGRWGHADQGGNVWEWILDWYGAYSAPPASNYANVSPSLYRVIRGGGFSQGPGGLRATTRSDFHEPTFRYRGQGLRCARCAPETDAQFCTRLGKNCGSITASDNCGTNRTVNSCGTCAPPQSCGGNNVCGEFVPASAQSCAEPDGGVGLLCNGESCCTSIVVPGGTFPQGRGTEDCGTVGCQTGDAGQDGCPDGMTCNPNEQPEHPSTVSPFALDKFEVTVGRFRKFVNAYVDNTASAPSAGAGANPNVPGSGWQSAWNTSLPATQAEFKDASHLNLNSTWQTWTDLRGTAAQESRTINCVDWYEAFAFCIWDGGRLATESEWEYAAAGGAENRLYPWGSAAPDCTHANFLNGSAYCGPAGPTNASVAVVGSYPAGYGRWGHADLAGNTYEWALDWLGTYPAAASTNFANLLPASSHVIRGCDFGRGALCLRAAARGGYYPDYHSWDVGLRCSRSAP